jgi:hypothetical protein
MDEWWHRNYDKDDEQARYHDVIMAWGGKLCFVRFNPNGDGPSLKRRLNRLRKEVRRHIERLEWGENTAYLEAMTHPSTLRLICNASFGCRESDFALQT